MEKSRKKKTAAGIVAVILAFAVTIGAFSAGIFYVDRQNKGNKLKVENFYQENIYEMSESTSNIEVNMSKLMISTDKAETAVLLNDTYHHAQTAIAALNSLPVNPEDKAVCDKFLNQLGDWCSSQCKKMMGGETSEGEEVTVASAEGSFDENDSLKTDSGKKLENKGEKRRLTTFDDQCEELYIRSKRLNASVREAANRLTDGQKMINNLSNGLMTDFDIADVNVKNSTDVPELIYDGPFSDSQGAKSFKGLESKEEISSVAAIKKAEKIFEDLGYRNVKLIGESTCPAAYALFGKTNKSELFVSISKSGGIVLSANVPCDNNGKKTRFGEDKCTEFAQKYAEMCGFCSLTPVWYSEVSGYAVVNLTPVKDGIVFYPDLVKVTVCQVTGDFAGIEAAGYCACHHDREFSPAIDEIEAQKAISNKLTISGSRLAVVPKDMKEKLCYEFAAEYKGLDYFIYVDANTGKQVNIMRVIDEEQGNMVM